MSLEDLKNKIGISAREMSTAMEKIQKATEKLRDIIPPKPRKSRVSPSVSYSPSVSFSGSGTPSFSESFSDSLSVSPSEEDYATMEEIRKEQMRREQERSYLRDSPYYQQARARKPTKKKPLKKEPLPSILERPKRKFKFEEEE